MIREEVLEGNPVMQRLVGSRATSRLRVLGIGLGWAVAGTGIPAWVAVSEILNNRSRMPDSWLIVVLLLSVGGVVAGPVVGALLAGYSAASDGQRGHLDLLRLTSIDGRRVVNGLIGAVVLRLRPVWGLMAGSLVPMYGVAVLWLARIYSRVACRWIVHGQCLPLERTLPRALQQGAVMALAVGVLIGGLAWLGVCSGTTLGLRFKQTRWIGVVGAGLSVGLLAAVVAWVLITREARLSWLVRAWRQPLAGGLGAFAMGEIARWAAVRWWDGG